MGERVRIGDVVALMESWFPPRWAEDWDAVGLVAGDPEAPVERVLLAVDPVSVVVDEALEAGADLVVTHHPLLLSGVHSMAATAPKGRVLHRLVAGGCGLFAAHTNADSPVGGVSEALALRLGLGDVVPLVPDPADAADAGGPLDLLAVYVPVDHTDGVRAALTAAGAGEVGDYHDVSFTVRGRGRFTPGEGAQPVLGEVGRPEVTEEDRLEVLLPRSRRAAVIAAMKAAHPYEEVAHAVAEVVPTDDGTRGSGRIGTLASPLTLREFAANVDRLLPSTAHGVRVAGDPDRPVRRVALCGGSGDFLLDAVRSTDADVFLTSDLRHHRAGEHLEHPGAPALVDVAHWAAEWTWLPVLAERLTETLAAQGASVGVHVSTTPTDPWTFRA